MVNAREVTLLMAEILHQMIGSLPHYPRGFIQYIPSGAGFLPSTVTVLSYNIWIVSSFFQVTFSPKWRSPRTPETDTFKPPKRVTRKNLDYDLCLYRIILRHVRRMNLAYLCQSLAPFQESTFELFGPLNLS